MKRFALILLPLWLCAAAAGARAEFQLVSVAVLAEVPLAQAWEKLRDFGVPHNYVPGLTRTEIVSDRRAGVGAHRRVYDEDGDFLEETIIAWHEQEGFVIKLHQGEEPMAPFQRAEFRYHLVRESSASTRIELTMGIVMPWGGLGETLADWFILPLMEDNLLQVAAGMKHYYETGQPASEADRERLAGAVTLRPGQAW